MINNELVSRDIRIKIRAFADHLVPSDIHDAWEAQFEWPEDFEANSYQSRDQFDGWSNSVDWTIREQALRGLYVFQDLVEAVRIKELDEAQFKALVQGLERAAARSNVALGQDFLFELPASVELDPTSFRGIKDPDAIHRYLDRLRRSLRDDDSELVIGAAKELMESTAWVAIDALQSKGLISQHELGKTPNFPKLLGTVHGALGLAPGEVNVDGIGGEHTKKAREGVRKILSGAMQVANGMAEYRNNAGTGHGGISASNLGNRHARLAINAAVLWGDLILATLQDPHAPWRKGENT